MDKIVSCLTLSEHHEEIRCRNLDHKANLWIDKQGRVFIKVKIAAVRVRGHSNKLIINAKFAMKGVHVIVHVTKGGTLSFVIFVNLSEEFSKKHKFLSLNLFTYSLVQKAMPARRF